MTATMKRVLGMAFALVVALSIFALAGCGGGKDMSKSPYCGTWDAKTATAYGQTVDVATIMPQFTVELKADGKASATVDTGNGPETGNGTWEETANGVKVMDSENPDGLEFTADENGNLTIEESGVLITFEKTA